MSVGVGAHCEGQRSMVRCLPLGTSQPATRKAFLTNLAPSLTYHCTNRPCPMRENPSGSGCRQNHREGSTHLAQKTGFSIAWQWVQVREVPQTTTTVTTGRSWRTPTLTLKEFWYQPYGDDRATNPDNGPRSPCNLGRQIIPSRHHRHCNAYSPRGKQ